jgi:MoxR-like ATPase
MEAGSVFALRERDVELTVIDDAVTALAEREPGLILIEGVAGIGKTSLVAAARNQSLRAGCRVLSARGSELEQEYPSA